jgi:HTH-type transcriptional regulator/antitoxin HigA
MARKNTAPIRASTDYRRAVKDLERLWNLEPGTPDHDRLERLGVLIDAYEAQRFPIEA